MPGRDRKYLQFAGFGFVDACPGVGSICNLLELDLQMPGRVRKHLQFAGIGLVDTYRGEFRMWKYLQFAGIGFADAYHQVDIKNPTTIAVGLFFMSKKRAKCSRGLAEHIVLKYNKASHFFLFFTGNCI